MRFFSVEHIYEAEQLLVRVSPGGNIRYEKLLGDIDFWKNVILRKGNPKIITKSGWELSFFESFAIRFGYYHYPLGKLDYNTMGIGLSLRRVLKTLRYTNSPFQNNTLFNFLTDHFDVQYNWGELDINAGHPLAGANFHGIKISIF